MINLLKQYLWQLLIVIVAAMAYAFLFGLPINLPLWFILLDGSVYAVSVILLIFVIGIAMKYSLSLADERGGHVCYLLVLGFLACIFLIGIESFIAYISSDNIYILFEENILQRMFIDILVYVIIIMNNSIYNDQQNKERENDIELSPNDSFGFSNNFCSSNDTNTVNPVIPSNTPITQVSVKIGTKIRIIYLSEIISIKADGDYVSIRTLDGSYLKEQTMKYFEENLPHTEFLRIHRSYIVRLSDIVRIERYGQMQQVEMRNGEKIRISANGYKLLRTALML